MRGALLPSSSTPRRPPNSPNGLNMEQNHNPQPATKQNRTDLRSTYVIPFGVLSVHARPQTPVVLDHIPLRLVLDVSALRLKRLCIGRVEEVVYLDSFACLRPRIGVVSATNDQLLRLLALAVLLLVELPRELLDLG